MDYILIFLISKKKILIAGLWEFVFENWLFKNLWNWLSWKSQSDFISSKFWHLEWFSKLEIYLFIYLFWELDRLLKNKSQEPELAVLTKKREPPNSEG
jgi:hypothetical protein